MAGIGYTVIGLLGIAGIANVMPVYKHTSFEAQARRDSAINNLMFGIPYIILHYIVQMFGFSLPIRLVLMVVFGIPSMSRSTKTKAKYDKMLKEELAKSQEN